MHRTSRHFRATRVFLAIAAISAAGFANATDIASVAGPAVQGVHTLTVEVCHPVASNNCTRDRSVVVMSEGNTVVLDRLTDVPYASSVQRDLPDSRNRPVYHFASYPEGFRLRLDTKQFEQDSAWVDYALKDKGLVAMRVVSSGAVTLNYPTTEEQEYKGRVELKAGVPTQVTLGFSAVTLTLDAK